MWPTPPSASRADQAGSARRRAPPPVNRVPATPSLPRGRRPARLAPPTTTHVRSSVLHTCPCICVSVCALCCSSAAALPSAQTKAGLIAKSSRRARRGISSRSTQPAMARGRSVPASPSCQKSICIHIHCGATVTSMLRNTFNNSKYAFYEMRLFCRIIQMK